MSVVGASPPLPELYGGVLCLDFANTVDSRAQPPIEEHLHRYGDLLRWARHADLLDAASVDTLSEAAHADPTAALAGYVRALRLREAIFRVFAALAVEAVAEPVDLDIVQQAYAEAMKYARLVPRDERLDWIWDGDNLDRVWWPVARSAIELATWGPTDRIKICASDAGCAGLFLDTTKNHSRRWCSMGDCGAEVKIRRQTARRRAARPPSGR